MAQANVGDIVEWTWTTPSWILSFTHRVEQTLNETATEPAVDGFISSKTGTANGEIYLFYPLQTKFGGVYRNHLVHPSIRPCTL